MPITAARFASDLTSSVWSLVDADEIVKSIARDNNRINALANGRKIKAKASDADLPELVIWRGGFADLAVSSHVGIATPASLTLSLIYTAAIDDVDKLFRLEDRLLQLLKDAGPALGLSPNVTGFTRRTSGVILTAQETQAVPTTRGEVRAVGSLVLSLSIRETVGRV